MALQAVSSTPTQAGFEASDTSERSALVSARLRAFASSADLVLSGLTGIDASPSAAAQNAILAPAIAGELRHRSESGAAVRLAECTIWWLSRMPPELLIRAADGSLELHARGRIVRVAGHVEGFPIRSIRDTHALLREMARPGRVEVVAQGQVLARITATITETDEIGTSIQLLDQMLVIEKHFGVRLTVPYPEHLPAIEWAHEVATSGVWTRPKNLNVPCGSALLRNMAQAILAKPDERCTIKFLLPRTLDLPGARVCLGPERVVLQPVVLPRSPEELLRIAAEMQEGDVFDLRLSVPPDGVLRFEYLDHLPLLEIADRYADLADSEMDGGLTPEMSDELAQLREAYERRTTPRLVVAENDYRALQAALDS